MILNKLRLNDKADEEVVTVWGSEFHSDIVDGKKELWYVFEWANGW